MTRQVVLVLALLMVGCQTSSFGKPFVEVRGDLSRANISTLVIDVSQIDGIDRDVFISAFLSEMSNRLPGWNISLAPSAESDSAGAATGKLFVSDRLPGTHQPPGPPPIQDEWTCHLIIVLSTNDQTSLEIVTIIPKTQPLAPTLAKIVADTLNSKNGPPNNALKPTSTRHTRCCKLILQRGRVEAA